MQTMNDDNQRPTAAALAARNDEFPTDYVLFSSTPNFKKLLQYLSHRMFAARVWSIKCRRKEKLIAQFGGKLRDGRFKSN